MAKYFSQSIFILIFLFVNQLIAQTPSDLRLSDSLPVVATAHHIVKSKTENKKLGTILIYLPYHLYKNFVSSQDGFRCSFYPSCANYCFTAVQKQGLWRGLFTGLDRLTRCHNKDHVHYVLHLPSKRWYDPVR